MSRYWDKFRKKLQCGPQHNYTVCCGARLYSTSTSTRTDCRSRLRSAGGGKTHRAAPPPPALPSCLARRHHRRYQSARRATCSSAAAATTAGTHARTLAGNFTSILSLVVLRRPLRTDAARRLKK